MTHRSEECPQQDHAALARLLCASVLHGLILAGITPPHPRQETNQQLLSPSTMLGAGVAKGTQQDWSWNP